jgi:hypothetical protein
MKKMGKTSRHVDQFKDISRKYEEELKLFGVPEAGQYLGVDHYNHQFKKVSLLRYDGIKFTSSNTSGT